MDRGQAVVVSEMEDNDVQDQRRMSGLDFVFRSKVDRDIVFPFFQFLVEITNGVQKLSIGLLRCFSGIKPFVHAAFDGCEST